MLQIVVPPPLLEEWDELREEFVYHESGKPYVLQLEHSLISLSNGKKGIVSHSYHQRKTKKRIWITSDV